MISVRLVFWKGLMYDLDVGEDMLALGGRYWWGAGWLQVLLLVFLYCRTGNDSK